MPQKPGGEDKTRLSSAAKPHVYLKWTPVLVPQNALYL
jgi:hypothetical protein